MLERVLQGTRYMLLSDSHSNVSKGGVNGLQ